MIKLFKILIFLYFLKFTNCITLKDAKIYKKTTNVLGSELSYAVFDLDLSSDLYMYDTISCPDFDCPASLNIDSTTDCSCDYTQCPPKTRSPLCPDSCSTIECSGDYEVIEFDKVYNYTIDTVKQFRIKANGLGCDGVSLKVNSIEGYGITTIGTSFDSNDIRTMGTSYQRNIQYHICPSDNIKSFANSTKITWTRDTYFITVTPVSNSFKFSIIMHSLEIRGVDTSSPSCQLTEPLNQTHTCLDIGKSYEFKSLGGTYNHYTTSITKPDYYYFNFPSIDQPYVVWISNSNKNIFPFTNNATWGLMDDAENNLLLYLEPINETTPLVLYINILVFYDSKVVFSITNYGKKYQYPISSAVSAQMGTFNLRSTSVLNVGESKYLIATSSSNDAKKSFSPMFPQEDINPLWPISSFLFDYYLTKSNLYPNSSSFKSKSYQASFLIERNSGYIYTKYIDYQSLLNSTLVINSNIFDINGKPVKIETQFREHQLECNIDKFNQITELTGEIEASLFSISDTNQINNYRFNLDALTISDAWYGCQSQIINYFEIETYAGTKSSKNCQYPENDPRFKNDPCCSNRQTYYQCCNPTTIPFNYTKYTLINSNLVKDQCSSPDCTLSVLSDFNRSISTIEECSVSDFTITEIEYNVYGVLRECKNKLVSPSCTSDSDCSNYGLNKCNLYKRQCIPDFEVIDKSYITCALENLPRPILYYLLNSTTVFNSSTIDQLFNQHLSQDCIGSQSIIDRSLYTYNPTTYEFCYKNNDCLDSTCIIKHDICYDNIDVSAKLLLSSRIGDCSDRGFCPYSDCSGLSSTECKASCSLKSFCGYCTDNNTNCHTFDDDQQSCENQNICLLPDGSYKEVADRAACESLGECSTYCNSQCSTIDNSPSGCYILSKDVTTCAESSGIWNASTKICTPSTPSDQNSCSGNNGVWIDCGSKVHGECAGPSGNLQICQLKQDKSCSREDCLKTGQCTDSYYFTKEANSAYPEGLGKCVHNHINLYVTLSCALYAEEDSPNGCYSLSPNILTKEACEANSGYRWWVPARNESECISQVGCKVLNPAGWGSLPYNFKFNEMSKEYCEDCQESLNKWTNKFEFTPATWLPGVYVSKQWYSNKSYVSNTLSSKVFSYEMFYDSVMSSLNTHIAEIYRSQAFCRMERIQSNLNSLSCSCFGGGGSKCFTSSVPLIGQTKVCADESSKFPFDFGLLNFTHDSIRESCQTLSISQISREIYTSTVPDSLASNFVSYNKPDNYAVYNDKGAIVGTLLSDGIMLKSQDGLHNVQICFKVTESMSYNQKYPSIDLAFQETDNDKPKPLGLIVDLNKDDDSVYYCGYVENVPKGNPIYFQMNRLNGQWRDKSKELFDQETKGLMYALAVIFLVVALAGFFELSTLVYLYIKKVITQFQLIHLLLVFVTGFILIRSVYFFLLVNGKLSDSPVADYILVVLPTFIYFTSFCLIIILWYVIVFLVLKKNRGADTLTKRLYSMVFIINLVLYMLFIAIVLVFQYTKYTPKNDCGSRIFVPTKTSAAQRGVSIAYAVIQAFISLLLGAAFIYLGSSLYKRLHFGNVNTGSKTNHQNKVFILSIICSLGFLLHCAFVLVLVSDFNSIVFSFIGLIITEVIPAIAIFYCFSPREKQRDKNGNSTTTGRSTKLSRYGGNESPQESQVSQGSSSNENQ